MVNYRIEGNSSVGIISITDAEGRTMNINDRRQMCQAIEYLEVCIRKKEDAKWFEGMRTEVIFGVENNKCQSLIDHLKEAENVIFPLHREYKRNF